MYMAGMYGSLVHLHLPTELCRFTSWQARPFFAFSALSAGPYAPAKCKKYGLRGQVKSSDACHNDLPYLYLLDPKFRGADMMLT